MNKKFKKYWEFILSAVLAIIAIVPCIYWLNIETDESKKLQNTANYIPEYVKDTTTGQLTIVLLILAVIIPILLYIIRITRENTKYETIDKKELEGKIKLFKKKLGKPKDEEIKYHRFEQINYQRQIMFGHIDYEPFFKMKNKKGEFNPSPTGIGYAILNEIFSVLNVKIKQYYESGNWDNVFNELEDKKYDIIVTPLYETRSRIYDNAIAYCIPLFYSEIGLFVHKDNFKSEKSIKEIKDDISKEKNKWKAPYIKGEISEIMAKKLKYTYSTDDNTIVEDDAQGFLNLLKRVNEKDHSKDNFKFNIVAMEVFKANAIIDEYNKTYPDDKLELKNILKEKQLLYPVSFIVRKEDTVLRNFINLRIAELYEIPPLPRGEDGLLIGTAGNKSLIDIIKEEAYHGNAIHPSKIDEMFIQTYNFSNLEEYSIY